MTHLHTPSETDVRRRFRDVLAKLHQVAPEHHDFIVYASLKKRDAVLLDRLLKEVAPKRILELGSYCGVSTRWLLMSAPDCHIDCVDPWPGDSELPVRGIFDAMVEGYRDRVTTHQAYFVCRNNQAYSVSTDYLSRRRTTPDFIDSNVPLFRPTEPYDLVFVDSDHRTTSSIVSFMGVKDFAPVVVYHDAFLATHRAAFQLVQQEWGGLWEQTMLDQGEDGLMVLRCREQGAK